MANEKSFFSKYYLLLIYLCFLLADCWFLYKGDYSNRKYSKTLLLPILAAWFMSNTAFNITSSANTLLVRLLLYFFLALTWAGDYSGLNADIFLWRACLFIYSIGNVVILFIITSIQKNLNEEKRLRFHFKTIFPTFFVVFLVSLLFVYKLIGFDNQNTNIWSGIHCFILSLLAAFTVNMVHTTDLKKILPLFLLSISFLLFTNAIYSIDELLLHRTHHFVDVIVAISNGIFQVLLILSVIKFLHLFHKSLSN